ncbi:PilW family protein [Polaromonas sp. UC242_47]|uniref:PilW family protein n=1 Tax=Polaromonas sp. UC242_47 TaxID=3374626 RepID=UPI0037B3208F
MTSSPLHQRERGMTLVELLVALVIGMLISLAAVSSLIVTRQGFNTVDAASQLRDNGRFAADLIQRIVVQTGFKDPTYVTSAPSQADIANDAAGLIASNITGFNNAIFKTSDLTTATARSSSVVGYGSDVLILRYQTAKLNNDVSSNATDGSMIDCAGNPITTVAADRNDRMVSVFHVGLGADGEPSLMCSRSANGLAPYTSQPIIQGVENFQVLYGVDGFTTANTAFTGTPDSVPEKYLRADQMVVGGATDSKATYDNWRRVRSIRIGMVLRGPLNSQQERVSQTFYPFGLAKASSTGVAGSALSSASDVGTIFTPAVDGRLRQVVTFTIHLRNDQGL